MAIVLGQFLVENNMIQIDLSLQRKLLMPNNVSFRDSYDFSLYYGDTTKWTNSSSSFINNLSAHATLNATIDDIITDSCNIAVPDLIQFYYSMNIMISDFSPDYLNLSSGKSVRLLEKVYTYVNSFVESSTNYVLKTVTVNEVE